MEDRQALQKQLTMAEKHVAQAERYRVRQREIIKELEQDGHIALAAEARTFLANFDNFHAQFAAERDRLKAELARMNSPR
jgi:hypothetical protein